MILAKGLIRLKIRLLLKIVTQVVREEEEGIFIYSNALVV
jgi:hypothetical protein